MTRFGKHPEKDSIDLASEAALGALSDANLTMKNVGVLAVGNLWAANMGTAQRLQKQIGQTGIPAYNVANACATGAAAVRTAIMALKAGECDVGMAVGVEKLAGAGLLTGANRKADAQTWTPRGRFGAVASIDGRIGTDTQPGTFSLISMEYGHRYGEVPFELFARIAEKNHAHSTLNPLAAYQKRMTLADITKEPMIAYPNTRVLRQL
jgi:acetyl-CoA acetyltransferase